MYIIVSIMYKRHNIIGEFKNCRLTVFQLSNDIVLLVHCGHHNVHIELSVLLLMGWSN